MNDEAGRDGFRRLGRFVLVRVSGAGGMGRVDVALHGRPGAVELCVLKRAHAEFRSPEQDARFRREAGIALRLAHDGIVRTLGLEDVDGELVLLQELVDGVDLRRLEGRLAAVGERLPLELAVAVVVQVARALAFAHSFGGLGIVHRDVTPDNVMLSFAGAVKLVDFGIARSAVDGTLTSAGQIVGRPTYTAPEVWEGARADRRADIYSLGVVLWQLAAGRTPDGAGLGDPAQAADALPAGLAAVVSRALDPEPARRYQAADELADALTPFLPESSPAGALAAVIARHFDVDRERRMLAEEVKRAMSLLSDDGVAIAEAAAAEGSPGVEGGAALDGRAAAEERGAVADSAAAGEHAAAEEGAATGDHAARGEPAAAAGDQAVAEPGGGNDGDSDDHGHGDDEVDDATADLPFVWAPPPATPRRKLPWIAAGAVATVGLGLLLLSHLRAASVGAVTAVAEREAPRPPPLPELRPPPVAVGPAPPASDPPLSAAEPGRPPAPASDPPAAARGAPAAPSGASAPRPGPSRAAPAAPPGRAAAGGDEEATGGDGAAALVAEAQTHFDQGDVGGALGIARRAVRAGSRGPAQILIGTALMNQHKYGDAERAFAQAAALAPGDPRAARLLALVRQIRKEGDDHGAGEEEGKGDPR